jgi:glycogen operon protein
MNYWELQDGVPFPYGQTWLTNGNYNFALYSKNATAVTLHLYKQDDPVNPIFSYTFDRFANKTERIWHCAIARNQVPEAFYYAYQVDGPFQPNQGDRFDKDKIILDPWAKSVYFPPNFSRNAASQPGSNAGKAPLGVLKKDPHDFDWGADPRPHHTSDLVIYEIHVRGFSQRQNSGIPDNHRGSYNGIIDKIPYLKDLGVTAVELLPVHQFDPQEDNYWGYMTLNFFAPHHQYSQSPSACQQLTEFKEMVKALHEAGLEVILDVVYNHTAEGDQDGPTYSFRGIDNSTYYLLTPDMQYYRNDTGTGNVMRTANKNTRKMVLDSLRYWVEEMHVDGFRFDLASIFTRNDDGSINIIDPPIVAEITSDPVLASVRLIGEVWDLATFQLGRVFPGINWGQWNGKYRDDMRRFVKGDNGMVGALMSRLYGSSDLFPDGLPLSYRPFQSINFITAHDGFCLYDLVSYNQKHNEANGYNNTDGTDANYSWNCGWEGDVNVPPEVVVLRKRQIKNFCALLMLANGTPMFCMGDEFMNTQKGNNNPYNQDNETTWLNWDLLNQNQDMFRFFKMMIAFRKAHPSIARGSFWRDDIKWYGVGQNVDLSYFSNTLAYRLRGGTVGDQDLYVMINAYWEPLNFTVQEGQANNWVRVVDTFLDSPQDIIDEMQAPILTSLTYSVGPRSVVVLVRK